MQLVNRYSLATLHQAYWIEYKFTSSKRSGHVEILKRDFRRAVPQIPRIETSIHRKTNFRHVRQNLKVWIREQSLIANKILQKNQWSVLRTGSGGNRQEHSWHIIKCISYLTLGIVEIWYSKQKKHKEISINGRTEKNEVKITWGEK